MCIDNWTEYESPSTLRYLLRPVETLLVQGFYTDQVLLINKY